MKNFLYFLGMTLALVLSAPTATAQGPTPGGQPDTCATAPDSAVFSAIIKGQLPACAQLLGLLQIGAQSTDGLGNPGWPVVIQVSDCNGLPTFDSAWVVKCPSAFPVELVDFEAEARESVVALSWSTTSEVNNDYFAVERSLSLATWTEVTQVAGAGTSNQVRTYQATDQPGRAGRLYYRLKQVDLDGTTTHSNVVQVDMPSPLEVQAYPNPTSGVLNVTGVPKGARVALHSLQGQAVMQAAATDFGPAQLDLSQLPPGVYLLQVTQPGVHPTTLRVVKN